MMLFRLIRLVMGRAHGSGISTACYPSPAPVHGLLSGDNERLKLCPRVQTPAHGLGRLHATVPGICSISWLCWWRVTQEGGLLPQPQPPTSPAIASKGRYRPDPDGLYRTWWWVPPHSITRLHIRFLKQLEGQDTTASSVGRDSDSSSGALVHWCINAPV